MLIVLLSTLSLAETPLPKSTQSQLGVQEDDKESEDKSGNGQKGKSGNGQKGKSGKGQKGKSGNGQKGKSGNGQKGKSGNGQKGKSGNGQKGKVEGPVNGKQTGKMKWNKYKEEQNIIFRPEFGVTTLNLDSQEQSVGGAHIGISVGTEKTKRLKSANVGLYTRSRVYGMGSLGSDLNVYDFRAGSVMGVKVLHAEAEVGFDLLRHMADSGITQGTDFQASNGFGIPAQALFVSDLFSVKIGAEPRWYFDGQPRGQENRAVDWSTHPATESLPLAPIGDEFSWTVGFRSGWFGLSYEQLLMNGGSQHTVSFGLQR